MIGRDADVVVTHLVGSGPGGAGPVGAQSRYHTVSGSRQLELEHGRQLGYIWPTTAYTIGGTATLALQYPIISSSAAASTVTCPQ